MIKKTLVGFGWAILFYIVACMLTGSIAGGIACLEDPQQDAKRAVRVAGARAVEEVRIYFVVGSLALAVVGVWKSILPGARTRIDVAPPSPND
jgi:hypothetical protein